ncbi:immunity protein Imm33 domain-containing protein [Marinobacterium lutimaris]|uniref:Immunity protein Imm33 domain-containing protein n=1 Tax=Marinobacterium lutimaris TaxID=568106 RepID=A0A1H5URW7_9GAMM|nr:DUF2185 domain-containing protein [Marinobacterium lutimaris]SEF77825.1 hypothetical protein SAMN05444390_101480 [Marinobacterium lutimaris]
MRGPNADTTMTADDETNQTKNGFLALVSRLVFDETLPVRFMYKTVPEHLNDTGWRMFTGYETEEFLENEQINLVPMPIERMVELDASLEELVTYNAGTVWERTPDAEGWERVHDFKIPAPRVDVEITNDIDIFNKNRDE